jgi:hypothetical protein
MAAATFVFLDREQGDGVNLGVDFGPNYIQLSPAHRLADLTLRFIKSDYPPEEPPPGWLERITLQVFRDITPEKQEIVASVYRAIEMQMRMSKY